MGRARRVGGAKREKGGREKHFESFESALLMSSADVCARIGDGADRGWPTLGVEGGNPESRLKGQMRNTFRSQA